jgi:hypothetical protein
MWAKLSAIVSLRPLSSGYGNQCGCVLIPVVVQTENSISNLAAISIDPSGACTLPALTLPPDLAQKLAGQTGIAFGVVNIGARHWHKRQRGGAVVTNKADNDSAGFTK